MTFRSIEHCFEEIWNLESLDDCQQKARDYLVTQSHHKKDILSHIQYILLSHELKIPANAWQESLLKLASENPLGQFQIFAFKSLLEKTGIELLPIHYQAGEDLLAPQMKGSSLLSLQELRELFTSTLHRNRPWTLYALLSESREHPGLFILQNQEGRLVMEDTSPWTLPVLGLSRRGLKWYQALGDTPQGIFYINGVMPQVNKREIFGDYRRLIVDYNDFSENDYKTILPSSVWNNNWWREALLAQQLGRSLLRIHGTLRVTENTKAPFYPFYPTSGCLTTRESGLFNDQRLLLDQLMKTQGLTCSLKNEEQLNGMLVVVNMHRKDLNPKVILQELAP